MNLTTESTEDTEKDPLCDLCALCGAFLFLNWIKLSEEADKISRFLNFFVYNDEKRKNLTKNAFNILIFKSVWGKLTFRWVIFR